MIRTSLNQRHLYFFYLSPNIYIKIILKLRTFHFLFSNELSLVSEPVSLFKKRKKNPPNSKHQILRERIRKKKNKIEIIEISNNPIIDDYEIVRKYYPAGDTLYRLAPWCTYTHEMDMHGRYASTSSAL